MCVDWLSLGVTVYVYAPCRPSESGCSGPCLLCPQPTAVLPGEGLTLPSVQPGVHRMFPRRCLRRHPLPWATLGSGPRRPGRWGWGHSLCGGGMSGPRNEGGGGVGRRRAQQVPPHSCPASHFLGACPGQGVDGRDEPYGLRAPGWGMDCPTRTHFCWAPGTQAWETGGAWVLLPTKPPSLLLCPALETKFPIYYSPNLTMPQ